MKRVLVTVVAVIVMLMLFAACEELETEKIDRLQKDLKSFDILRDVNYAIVRWMFDKGPEEMPKTYEELKKVLIPKYIRALPEKDLLGKPVFYEGRGKMYYLAFSGEDMKLTKPDWTEPVYEKEAQPMIEKDERHYSSIGVGDDHVFKHSIPPPDQLQKVMPFAADRKASWTYDQKVKSFEKMSAHYRVSGMGVTTAEIMYTDGEGHVVKKDSVQLPFFVGVQGATADTYLSISARNTSMQYGKLFVEVYRRDVLKQKDETSNPFEYAHVSD